MLSFKPTFSLSTFTFIKRLFSSSSLSAIRVVSSAYLRLLIFLPALLIPACAYSSPAFLIIYSAYRLNKQGDNIQPWCTHSFSYLEPVCCSMSSSNCCSLTCIQISQEAGQVVWYAHLFQNFPQFIVIHTVKGFGIVNKFGHGIQNEAGQRLRKFCQENSLVIANTLFQQDKRRLYTWTSPDGQHWNQIDYILCSRRWKSAGVQSQWIQGNSKGRRLWWTGYNSFN